MRKMDKLTIVLNAVVVSIFNTDYFVDMYFQYLTSYNSKACKSTKLLVSDGPKTIKKMSFLVYTVNTKS